MPTPIVPAEKTAFIDLVQVVNPMEALRLVDVLNNYEDVATVIGRQLEVYAERNTYLTQCLGVLDDTELIAVGIYNNKTGTGLNDPVLLVNSQYSGDVTINANQLNVVLLGNSFVERVLIQPTVELEYLYIGSGCTVNILDSSGTDSMVNNLLLPYLRSTPSSLNLAELGSQIGNIQVDEGSYFGGFRNYNPLLPCADNVTGITATEATKNGVFVSWTPPATYLLINIAYKKTESKTWIPTTTEDGEYVGDTGFVFRHLDSDTYYSFKVSVTCLNGGVTSTEINTQTTCCGGAGTPLMLYKPCKIVALIVASPNPANTQTLCNGVTIPKEYPAGPTLVIPYLIDKWQLVPFIVDNANVNDVPFDKTTGTFNAAASTLTTFVEGNEVEMNFALPA